jgi:hypothetical protein
MPVALGVFVGGLLGGRIICPSPKGRYCSRGIPLPGGRK